jgi:Ca2+-binding EF-hand superfamily protein
MHTQYLLLCLSIGEPFTQEEMEEMLSAAVDPEKGVIFYKDFVAMMVVDDA